MNQRNALFEKLGGLLHRPRIDALLEKAAGSPLVQVVAGPGYGKTAAVADYVQGAGTRLIWMRMTRLDQLPGRFWQNFLCALEYAFPARLREQLEGLGYPDSLYRFDAFLRIFAEESRRGAQVCFVADDFGSLGQCEVRAFFEMLVEARMDNFCLILIGRTASDVAIAGMHYDETAVITHMQLRFTPAEARRLFREQGIKPPGISPEELAAQLDGWPLPLYMLVQQPQDCADAYPSAGEQGRTIVRRIFETEYFRSYAEPLQKLLIKLSLLNGFTIELAKRISGEAYATLDALLYSNPFIVQDPSSRAYVFHNMYADFLAGQHARLKPEEQSAVFSLAGDCCRDEGLLLEAIEYYNCCARYEDILEAIARLEGMQMSIGADAVQTDHLQRVLENMPEAFRQTHPLADYLIAFILLSNLEIERSWEVCVLLESRLKHDSAGESQALLGQVYALQGALRMLQNREDFGVYYARACALLPPGGSYNPGNKLLVENNHHFSMQDTGAGAAARMERAVHEGVPYLVQAMSGGARGMDHLFSSEAGLLMYDLEKARKHAHLAIHEAEMTAQHDIICNAHLLLARAAIIQGEYPDAAGHIDFIQTYIEDRQLHVLDDLKDTACSWLALKMEDWDKMAGWIIEAGISMRGQPLITIGRDRVLSAGYLLLTEQYAALLALLERMDALFLRRGLWADRLYTYVLRAVAHMKLHEEEAALHWLHTAYEMSVHNNIVLPFIDQGRYMRALVDLARRSRPEDFEAGWLDGIAQRASTFSKKLTAMQKEYHGHRQAGVSGLLSKREEEMLRGLSIGLTREELAGQHHISINTVKTIIRSLYNKLGAVNRADAIRIATSQNLL